MSIYASYDSLYLLKLLAENDSLAFTEIYDRYWEKLYAIAYNRLKEIQTAEDIVHDAFLSLWQNRHKQDINNLESYLASATKYLVLAAIRKKELSRKYTHSVSPSHLYEPLTELQIHNKYILEMVKEEIEKLPEKCKLIFKYSREEEMPVKQIAEKLNLSPKTVENQIGKALKKLKAVTKAFFSLLP